jgi:hypothetical protein
MDVVWILGLRVFVLFYDEELGLFSRHVDTPRLREPVSESSKFIALKRAYWSVFGRIRALVLRPRALEDFSG